MPDTDLFVIKSAGDLSDLMSWLWNRTYNRSIYGEHMTDATKYHNPMIGLKLGDARAGLIIVHNKEDLFDPALKAVLECQRAEAA